MTKDIKELIIEVRINRFLLQEIQQQLNGGKFVEATPQEVMQNAYNKH